MQEILLNVESKETRCAHLKNGLLYDLTIERKNERQLTGNIYLGWVKNVLRNIQSAFIDIGEGDNGFIHISDILENTKKFEEIYEMDFDLDTPEKPQKEEQEEKNIEELLKIGQPVLVQVVKEAIGSKGARLTSNISIAGRYLVLLPNSSHRGVSRRIEDPAARDRLKRLIRSFEMPQEMGLICRTASTTADPEALISEAHDLVATWREIMEKFKQSQEPTLLFAESDLIKRTLMHAIDHRYERILIDHAPTYHEIKRLYSRFQAEHPIKIELYRDKTPIFERFNVEREIERSLRRKIWIPSGGYLFFDRTEAMTTIDVNSGRSTNQESDVEESLVRINLEAAEEIARQLRLRNIGGLVICDFIDMRSRKNQKRVLEKLRECMKEDSAKCTILGMSEFGLIEMTRQRSRSSLMQTIFCECPYCNGTGLIKSHETLSIEIERSLKKVIHCQQQYALKLVIHPELNQYLKGQDKAFLSRLAEEWNARLEWETDDNLHLNEYQFISTINRQKLEV